MTNVLNLAGSFGNPARTKGQGVFNSQAIPNQEQPLTKNNQAEFIRLVEERSRDFGNIFASFCSCSRRVGFGNNRAGGERANACGREGR